ncbi:hypothetical protein N657DRAFT_625393 [Parathielavia appendiculata]|uniref:Uncharacterized protein n=1 Tax=Parathielavia appendiculata TaxID=2587402 RepID=A0AAN6TTJ7_9PEZI|nr:hypothetical protein N657DRAFT_625393 [Parathielavia appendiculata]
MGPHRDGSRIESSLADIKLAGIAFGFTLGFGFLTVWKAIKQTMAVSSPRRSIYVILVWIEIFSNMAIAIMAWLLMEEVLPSGNVTALLAILIVWIFEIHCIMQIIINRVYVVAEDKDFVRKVKWGTAILISAIIIAVSCIWLPAHIIPLPSPRFLAANRIWDPISKALIGAVDASLNIWFLVTVRRVVKFYGLKKYDVLVRFNARLIIFSVSLDALLIGLLFMPNPFIYLMFHPVVYMIKLNIEMTMASLILKLARVPLADTMALRERSRPSMTGRPSETVSV